MKKEISLIKFKLSFLKTTPYISWLKKYENIKYIGRDELFKKIKINSIKKYIIDNIRSRNSEMFLVLNDKKIPVGTAKIGHIDWYHKRGDLGVMIDYDFRKRGYATRAVSILIKYGFKKLKLNKLTGGCENRNISMKKVFIKNKFKLEGIKKENIYSRDSRKFIDQAFFGLIKNKYH